MKRIFSGLLVLLLCVMLFAACQTPPPSMPASGSEPVPQTSSELAQTESSPLLVAKMMELDYGRMSVEEFNNTIQEICADAGTSIFDVIVDLYEMEDELTPNMIHFLRTTLDYSSQEIFGEPVYLGSSSYITAPGVTAREMWEKERDMEPADWDAYFDSIIADIEVYAVVHYEAHYSIADPGVLTVVQRDEILNGVRSDIQNFVIDQSEEDIEGEGMKETIEKELEKIAAAHSDENVTINCLLQMVEVLGEEM